MAPPHNDFRQNYGTPTWKDILMPAFWPFALAFWSLQYVYFWFLSLYQKYKERTEKKWCVLIQSEDQDGNVFEELHRFQNRGDADLETSYYKWTLTQDYRGLDKDRFIKEHGFCVGSCKHELVYRFYGFYRDEPSRPSNIETGSGHEIRISLIDLYTGDFYINKGFGGVSLKKMKVYFGEITV